METLKVSIHPLFFVFGFYYALTGRILSFVICAVSAVIHELGHSLVASFFGYKLDKITLMPFGAIVSGETEYDRAKEEALIAVAGPMVNFGVGIFFVALWWVFPEIYPLTDVIVQTNFSLAIFNLLPFLPLDGGRVLRAVLTPVSGKKKANKTAKIIGIIFSVALFALFILSIFYKINVSLCLFSLFIFVGAIDNGKENVYTKIFINDKSRRLSRGMPYKKQGVDQNMTVKKLMSILDNGAINEIVVYSNEKESVILSQDKINDIIEKGELNSPIYKYL